MSNIGADFKGTLELYIPGVQASITIGEKSETMDAFLQAKESKDFFFLSCQLESFLETKVFTKDDEREIDFIAEAMEQEVQYYLAGFKVENTAASEVCSGIVIVNTDREIVVELMKKFNLHVMITGGCGIEARTELV